MNLFLQSEKIIFNLPNAEVEYYPNFYKEELANTLFEKLQKEIQWQQDNITVFGKNYPQPRLTSLYGDAKKKYTYSNIIMHPHPWNTTLLEIKNEVELICHEKFTSVLLNLYRDGRDSNGWHTDDEKELGPNPVIVSLSFGATRDFHLKHNSIKEKKIKIPLENGSLLVMKGSTQHFWKHQIAKTSKNVGARINLTFRKIN